MQSETQTASSRIWTWVADSISYDDNHYAKCTLVENIKSVSHLYNQIKIVSSCLGTAINLNESFDF